MWLKFSSDNSWCCRRINGPAISTLKGTTTGCTDKPVMAEEVEIPPELLINHRQIELCMDTMFVNGEGVLTTIDKTVRFCSSVPIKARTADEYIQALYLKLWHYNKGGFQVHLSHCDWEHKSIINPVKDKLVDMNFSNPGEDIPEAEWNNITIKERVRATFHRLPYKAIPLIMVSYLIMDCNSKLNMFPAKR